MVERTESKAPSVAPRSEVKAHGDESRPHEKPVLVVESREHTDESLGVERTAADELLTSEHEVADKALKKLRTSADTVIADVRERDEALLARRPEDPDELVRVLKSERHTEDQARDAERNFLDRERMQAVDERAKEENATTETRKVTDENLSRERAAEDLLLKLSEEPFGLLVSQVKDFAIFLLDPGRGDGLRGRSAGADARVQGDAPRRRAEGVDVARGAPRRSVLASTRECCVQSRA